MEKNFLKDQFVKEGYATIEEAEANKLTPEQVANKNSKGYVGNLHLHKHMTRWAVYPTGVAPVTGNQCGYISPSQFQGLSYFICWNAPYNDVYCIYTESWGYVHIYAPHDSDCCFNAYSTFCINCYERHESGTFDWNRNHKNCTHNMQIIG